MMNGSTVFDYLVIAGISQLSSEQTQSLLTEWGASASVLALETIRFENADFTADETCVTLANFINDARILDSLDLSN